MAFSLPRDAPDGVIYTDPSRMLNAGIWSLFMGASVFLGLRLYTKFSRHTGLWYDDYILISSWLVLMANDIVISIEFATGYVTEGGWDDRMHILINISSCGTLVGQALSKTAFAVTLLRMSNRNQKIILWICIGSMNGYMAWKCIFQWAKLCGRSDYQQWYRLQTGCINYQWEQDFKEGGNVLNIIMDFVFALFPWWITWPLEMKRMEKVGLCFTMSLGIIVAIVSAIRTGWKDTASLHKHDDDYMVRNATSMIWYSSEVAGTIIVQCIPILRPFIRDIHTSLTSKRLADTTDPEGQRSQNTTWRSTIDGKRGSGSAYKDGKRISAYKNQNMGNIFDGDRKKIGTTTEIIALSDIPEDREHESMDQHQRDLPPHSQYQSSNEQGHETTDDDNDNDHETEREIMGWKKGFSQGLEVDSDRGHRQARSEASSQISDATPTMPAGPLPGGHPGTQWRFSEASTNIDAEGGVQSPTIPIQGNAGWVGFMERDKERERNRDSDEEKGAVGAVRPLAPMPPLRNFSRGGR